jgi:ribosomal protein L7/L12
MTPFIIALLTLFLAMQGFVAFKLAQLRRAGLYPQPGQATMADVQRLLRAGHRVWAVRCYREVHHCDLAEAKKAVDELSVST